jgi:hypothetical protein
VEREIIEEWMIVVFGFGKIGVTGPGQPRKTIQAGIILILKSPDRPGNAFPEFRILSAAGTGNFTSLSS